MWKHEQFISVLESIYGFIFITKSKNIASFLLRMQKIRYYLIKRTVLWILLQNVEIKIFYRRNDYREIFKF